MKNALSTALACALILGASSARCDEGYRLSLYSINAGGAPSSNAGRMLNCSIGQSVANFVRSGKSLMWIGFWSGEMPEPPASTSIVTAKQLAEGALVSAVGKVVTTSSDDFPGFYYIEEPTRISGIRVANPTAAGPRVALGDVVDVIGTISLNEDGEMQIEGPIVSVVGTHEPLRPLGMTNGAVGAGSVGCQSAVWGWCLVPKPGGGNEWSWQQVGGLNTVGLRVTTTGRVTFVDAPAGVMTIDDGTNVSVKCVVRDGVALDPSWTYVAVTGVASCEKAGAELHRVIRVRAQEDIVAR